MDTHIGRPPHPNTDEIVLALKNPLGLSIKEISEHYDVSLRTIFYIAKRSGIDTHLRKDIRNEDARIKRLRNELQMAEDYLAKKMGEFYR